jgi:hypothetical protein
MDAGTGPGQLHRCLVGLFGSAFTVSLIALVVLAAGAYFYYAAGWD